MEKSAELYGYFYFIRQELTANGKIPETGQQNPGQELTAKRKIQETGQQNPVICLQH